MEIVMNLNNKPNSISLCGQEYSLNYAFPLTGKKTYPQVVINVNPLITIEHNSNIPYPISLKLAEIAIFSYKENNGRYAYLPDNDMSSTVTLEQAFSDLTTLIADVYDHFGTSYLVIEGSVNDKFFQFAIFDHYLCRKLITHKHIMNPSSSELISFNLSMDIEYLDSLIMQCAHAVGDIESKVFNETLANIQQNIGQDDSGFAEEYFYDYDGDIWDRFPVSEKIIILTNYVKAEMKTLLSK
jgi:hypothetical protein